MLILPSQEDFADFNQSESRTQEGFGDFDQDYSEDPGPTQACGEEVGQGDLPLSDSFADFHSAPLEGQGEREEGWGRMGTREVCRRGRPGQSLERRIEPGGQKRQRRRRGERVFRGCCCTKGQSAVDCSVLDLKQALSLPFRPPCLSGYRRVLQTSFPAWQSQNWIRRGRRLGWRGRRLVERRRLWRRRRRRGWRGQWVEVLNVLSLRALLETLDTQPEEEETKGLNHTTHWVPRGAWRQPQDLHDAVGLGFQWGGSHSNRALLRCLGMDTRNMLFTGQRKQPVIVPVFAASLGMLEAHQRATESSFSCGEDCCTQALPGSQETTTTSSIKVWY
nr:uncharacterized protein LOC112072325 [Salvelinus alpinus]